jgi:hypothetical protein
LPHSIIGSEPILLSEIIFGRMFAIAPDRLESGGSRAVAEAVSRIRRRSVFVSGLRNARGAAAAAKLLLEYRFECEKRARRTPQRVQGVSRHHVGLQARRRGCGAPIDAEQARDEAPQDSA